MFLALWGLRSVIWLSSRNESADQPVPGVDIVLRPCQVPANLLKNLNQKNRFFRLTPFAYDPFWGYAINHGAPGDLMGGCANIRLDLDLEMRHPLAEPSSGRFPGSSDLVPWI